MRDALEAMALVGEEWMSWLEGIQLVVELVA